MVIREFCGIKSSTMAALSFLCLITLLVTNKYLFSLKKSLPNQQNIIALGEPHQYTDEVDFRIIVITFKRPQSLIMLLESIDTIELDGDTGALEIWIDRDKRGRADNKTIEIATSFHWQKGPTRVHVHRTHVGIYGQWINTWRPKSLSSREIVLFLEDDMNVSKYCYRWLKKVHRFYETSTIFAAATLQSDHQNSQDGKSKPLKAPKNHTIFMYKSMGPWGFSPNPAVWTRFQNWVRVQSKDRAFCPCVPGLSSTMWYKMLRKEKKDDSMWTVWFTYYAYIEKLFTVYNNLNAYNGNLKSCLSINRREPGLHYTGGYNGNQYRLLSSWKEEYTHFPERVTKFDWNGSYIDKY